MENDLALGYTGYLQLLYDFQPLLAGLLAIVAAAATAWVIWRAASFPVRYQKSAHENLLKRRKQFLSIRLSNSLVETAARARQARGTVQVHIGDNADIHDETRAKVSLYLDPVVNDWEFMSLLSAGMLYNIGRLQRKLNDHNFDVKHAGRAFGSQDFQNQILARLDTIYGQTRSIAEKVELELRTD